MNHAAPRNLTIDALKITALMLMVVDHAAVYGGFDPAWRLPGRVVLPWLAVVLAHNLAHHTRDAGSTMLFRLFAWACVAELALIPLDRGSVNILFTLGAGLYLSTLTRRPMLLAVAAVVLIGVLEALLGVRVVEYGVPGVLLVWSCSMLRFTHLAPLFSCLCLLVMYLYIPLHGFVAIAALGAAYAALYPRLVWGWVERVPPVVWYVFYPIHLLLLWGVYR